VIALLFSLFLIPKASAINADLRVEVTPAERFTFFDRFLRSTVAVQAEDDSLRCSGTLVSSTQVLTSGHCFDPVADKTDMKYHVHLMETQTKISKTIAIKDIQVHPLWLMGRDEILRTNAKLDALYKKLYALTPPQKTCLPGRAKWQKVNLREAYNMARIYANQRPGSTDPCDVAVRKIVKLLEKNSSLLDEKRDGITYTRLGDLALVELAEPVNDDYHRPMKIDFSFIPDPKNNYIALIAGFGMEHEKQKLTSPVNPLSFGLAQFLGSDSEDLMIVGEGAVVCPGDSGGPTALAIGNELILVGVNAGTAGCHVNGGWGRSVILNAHEAWLKPMIKN